MHSLLAQRVGTSFSSPLQWLQQACGDHSWTYLFNSYSDGATGWQQRWQSASSVHAVYLSTNTQQWGLTVYTEHQQRLWEALSAAMEMGAIATLILVLLISSYIQESIAVMWQSIQLSMYVYSCLPCLNTWRGRSLCSKCMWHHVCVWFSLSSWFLCYTIVSLHCSVSCSGSPHNVLHSTTCICLCMVVYYLKPPCTN